MKKGVSLAIETIIVIALGVTILMVLSTWLLSQQGPTQKIIDETLEHRTACANYVSIDRSCNNLDRIDEAENGNEILNKVIDICQKVNNGFYLYDCQGSDLNCVKACCKDFCPYSP